MHHSLQLIHMDDTERLIVLLALLRHNGLAEVSVKAEATP